MTRLSCRCGTRSWPALWSLLHGRRGGSRSRGWRAAQNRHIEATRSDLDTGSYTRRDHPVGSDGHNELSTSPNRPFCRQFVAFEGVKGAPIDNVRGVRRADLARFGQVQVIVAQSGKGYVRMALREPDVSSETGTDLALLADGYATVTPLRSPTAADDVIVDLAGVDASWSSRWL